MVEINKKEDYFLQKYDKCHEFVFDYFLCKLESMLCEERNLI